MNDNTMMTRRSWLAAVAGTIAGGVALGALASPASAESVATPLTVYKDPSCGCCTKWVAHLNANGLKPVVKDYSDMASLKDSLGVPKNLRSCHTAVAGKYVIEGHVPAADLKRLLASAPKDVVGIAVPDMPAGSPGMEMGVRKDHYDVIAFSSGGRTHVFASHA
ncbi:DUF411 domain-containing protein [soil metagenome]